MKYHISINKMTVRDTDPVSYYFLTDNNSLYMNDLIGKKIQISYNQIIYCIACNEKIKKTFHQGYCY